MMRDEKNQAKRLTDMMEDKAMKKMICGLLMIALCLSFCGCGFSASASYPHAEMYTVGNFTYDAATVHAVEINWTSGRVELSESDGDKLAVTETTQGLTEDQQMRWWLDGSTLRIQYWKSGYTGTLVNKEKRVTVEIPKDISLNVHVTSGEIRAENHQLKDMVLQATSGEIQTGAVNADSITVQATSGELKAGPLRAQGKLSMQCTSGSIRIDNAMADTVTLESTSGNVTAGPVDAKSLTVGVTSGKIKLEAVKAETAIINSTSGDVSLGVYQCGKVDISCNSGDVTLSTVHGSGATVNFKTNSGSLNGKDAKKNAQQIIGDGASIVNVNTTSGDLKITDK